MGRVPPSGERVFQSFARNPARVNNCFKAPTINPIRWPQTWRRANMEMVRGTLGQGRRHLAGGQCMGTVALPVLERRGYQDGGVHDAVSFPTSHPRAHAVQRDDTTGAPSAPGPPESS